jgi:hypothetical protein
LFGDAGICYEDCGDKISGAAEIAEYFANKKKCYSGEIEFRVEIEFYFQAGFHIEDRSQESHDAYP